MNVTQEITKWNYERNELVYDSNLETSMLCEEANEFMVAYSKLDLIKCLDAIADIEFVLVGTSVKSQAMKTMNIGSFSTFKTNIKEAEFLIEEFTNKVSYFKTLFMNLVNDNTTKIVGVKTEISREKFQELYDKCLEAVIEANKKKGNKRDQNGKVIKDPAFIGPEGKIKELFKEIIENGLQEIQSEGES